MAKIIELILTIVGIAGWIVPFGALAWLMYRPLSSIRAGKLIKKWAGSKISPFDRVKNFFVYFLDMQGKTQSLPVRQFEKLRLPEFEQPKVWLCCLGIDNKTYLYLGSLGKPKWSLPIPNSLNSYLVLADQNGKTIHISEKANELERITTILQIASQYQSVDEYALKLIADYAVPILEETKHSMGKSPALANIRKALELKTDIFRLSENVNFEQI